MLARTAKRRMTVNVKDYAAEKAIKAVGNWLKFESFAWFGRPEKDADNWAIVYTSSRDSDCLERCNAAVIADAMEPFEGGQGAVNPENPDCVSQSHSHWAVGYVEGFAIRVYRPDGSITPAWLAYCDMMLSLEDYPILDEDRFSTMEEEEACGFWVQMGLYDRLCAWKHYGKGSSFLSIRHNRYPDWAFEYLRMI